MSIEGRSGLGVALALASLVMGCESGGQPTKAEPAQQRPRAPVSTAAVAPKPPAPSPQNAEDWNDAQIKWMTFDEGMASAKTERKPVCLVFYTQWCPHCRNYSAVFRDPRVVDKAKQFVMVRLDKDKNAPISARFAPDGEYIPRTMFLSSEGVLDESIHAPRPQYKFFYDERSADGVLAGMDEALKKLK